MKSMCCLCIQFTNENTSERTILHQVSKKNYGGGGEPHQTPPPPFPGMVDCTTKKASYAHDKKSKKHLFVTWLDHSFGIFLRWDREKLYSIWAFLVWQVLFRLKQYSCAVVVNPNIPNYGIAFFKLGKIIRKIAWFAVCIKVKKEPTWLALFLTWQTKCENVETCLNVNLSNPIKILLMVDYLHFS